MRCEGSLDVAPDFFRAVCAGDADFVAWPRATFCDERCPGHPLCGPCAALSIQRKELQRCEYMGESWEPEQ